MEYKEIIDDYTWSESKKIITHDHHKVSGLANLSHFSLGSNNFVPLHYHSDIIEIHCIVKGQRTIIISQNGTMNHYTAYGNELMITYPFELHETSDLAKNRNEFYAIQLNVREGLSLLGLNEEYSARLRQEICSLPYRHLKVGHTQLSQLRTAFNLAFGNSEDIFTGTSYLLCFLLGLKYLDPVEHTSQKMENQQIQKAFSYIADHIDQKITLQKLADISGYSLSHFKFVFKEHFGITPAEYIILQKINYAEKEILSNDISITELAHKLNFSSSNYFCTVFKKVLGYTPTEYRKLFKKQ